jgi:hypothetical protein
MLLPHSGAQCILSFALIPVDNPAECQKRANVQSDRATIVPDANSFKHLIRLSSQREKKFSFMRKTYACVGPRFHFDGCPCQSLIASKINGLTLPCNALRAVRSVLALLMVARKLSCYFGPSIVQRLFSVQRVHNLYDLAKPITRFDISSVIGHRQVVAVTCSHRVPLEPPPKGPVWGRRRPVEMEPSPGVCCK